ncbi:hypothetical protein ACT3UQ_05190 [Glutamicibacter sp. AOP12-B1-11]|uniref:hypothetical protein n=1 Tax=Glutamicibacter sp. AOP12-B1-11 TaxID=3457725 RepID=UPI0040335599
MNPELDLGVMRSLVDGGNVLAKSAVLALIERVQRAEWAFERMEQQALEAEAKLEAALKVSQERPACAEDAERRLSESEERKNIYKDKLQAVREALTEVQGRGQRISNKEKNGSIRSYERAARGDGYLEAARLGLAALDGEHAKQLGGTPTGEFAEVCSCGKSYWPCDSLDGES